MSDTIPEDLQKLVDAKAAELSEHFDSVRVMVTLHAGGDSVTASYEAGRGNFYAQLGQVREWLQIQDQYQREFAKSKEGGGLE